MENRKTNGREINIRSLIVRILMRWRTIVIAVLLSGLAGSAFKYVSLKRDIESAGQSGTVPAAEQNDIGDKEYYQAQIDAIDQTLQDRKEYLYKTLVKDMDPYGTGIANTTLLVKGNGTELSAEVDIKTGKASVADPNAVFLVTDLVNYIQTGIDWTGLKNELGVEDDILLNEMVWGTREGNVLTVSASFSDKQTAQKIMDFVMPQLRKEFAEAAGQLGDSSYELIETDNGSSDVIFAANFTWMYARLKEITDLEAARKDVQSKLNSVNSVVGGGNAKPTSISKKAVLKTGIKAAVLGFAAVIILILLYFIYGDKVLSAREMNDFFRTRNIAVFPGKNRKGIDQALMRLDRENRSDLSEDVRYELAVTNIHRFCSEAKNIAVITDVNSELAEHVRTKLEQTDHETGYILLRDLNNNVADRNALLKADGIIVVAHAEKSGYQNISDLLTITENYNVPVIGTVTFS